MLSFYFFQSKRVLLVLFLAIALGLMTLGITTLERSPDPTLLRMRELEQNIQQLRALVNVDSQRQYHIQKVIGIIDRYNREMSSELKYQIADLIYQISIKYPTLDVELISALITHESGHTWKPDVVSPVGALGLMQVMPATGMFVSHYEGITWTSAEEVLFNPIYNIRIGCRYLAALIEAYGVEGGLAAYNGGESRASLWLANQKATGILPRETANYVPAVLALYEYYKNPSS